MLLLIPNEVRGCETGVSRTAAVTDAADNEVDECGRKGRGAGAIELDTPVRGRGRECNATAAAAAVAA